MQALTLEGWPALMYDAMYLITRNDSGPTASDTVNQIIAALFYVIWITFGTYILLSMLVSSVLDNFERDFYLVQVAPAKPLTGQNLQLAPWPPISAPPSYQHSRPIFSALTY